MAQLLLIEVFVFVFVVGFFPVDWQNYLYSSLYTLLFFTCALNLDKHRNTILWISSGAILLEWVARIYDLPLLHAASKILNLVFFIVVVGLFIRQIARAREVTGRVIFEAINGYLLLGIVFSLLITLSIIIDERSFSFSMSGDYRPNDIIYYGFVTLSTLGYGDLLPVEPYARSIALLTTLGGQLYLTVIIALLVGKFSSRTNRT